VKNSLIIKLEITFIANINYLTSLEEQILSKVFSTLTLRVFMYPYAEVYRLDNSIPKSTYIYAMYNVYEKKIALFKLVNCFFEELSFFICNFYRFNIVEILKKGKVPNTEFLDNFQFIGGE